MNKEGLPANTNPFLIVSDECVDDDSLEKAMPDYFMFKHSCDLPFAILPTSPVFSQEEAEILVRKVLTVDPEARFAVQEQHRHIIPEQLKNHIRLTKETFRPYSVGSKLLVGMCRSSDCYLEEK